jgi:opacity protein-like surface antigen
MRRFPIPTTLAVLALLLPSAAAGQGLADYDYENLAFRGVGLDWGYIWPSKVDATQTYSMRIDLGYLGPAVRIAPTISFWSSSLKRSELDRLADRLSQLPPIDNAGVIITADDLGQVDWSNLTLGVDAHFVWTAPLDIITYLGAGLGLHALNGRGETIDDTFVEDLLDSTTAGAALMGGIEFQPTSRLRLYGEARYTLASDIRYPGVRVGAALMLPAQPASQSSTSGGR